MLESNLFIMSSPRPKETPNIPGPFQYEAGSVEFRPPNLEYLRRMDEWLRYLGIQEGMGFSPEQVQACTRELPRVLTELVGAGGGTIHYGEAYPDETRVVQHEYAGVLAHEMIHGQWEGALDEGAAVALGIYGFGAERDIKGIVYGNSVYAPSVKRYVAVVNEATFMDGRHIFALFDELKKARGLTFPNLLTIIDRYLSMREQQFNQLGESADDYLVDRHRVTREVANIALETTGLSKENVFRNNCEMLKLHIDAFKQLVTFYHINIGLRLDEAIKRVEEMFKKGDAIDIASSLHDGAQQAHSLLREAKCDPNVRRMISQMMIENGSDWANKAARQIPCLLKLAEKYGPRGEEIIRVVLNNPSMLFKLVLGRVFSKLLDMHEGVFGEAKQVHLPVLILEKLTQMKWSNQIRTDMGNNPLIGSYREKLWELSREEKAQVYALMAYLDLEQPPVHPFSMINDSRIANEFSWAKSERDEDRLTEFMGYRGSVEDSSRKTSPIVVQRLSELQARPVEPAQLGKNRRPTSQQRQAAERAVQAAIKGIQLDAPQEPTAQAQSTPVAPPNSPATIQKRVTPPQQGWFDKVLKKLGL